MDIDNDALNRLVAEALTKQGCDWAWAVRARQMHCNRAHGPREVTCRDCGEELIEADYEEGKPLKFSTSPDAAWRLLEYLSQTLTSIRFDKSNDGRWCHIMDMKAMAGYRRHGETMAIALCKVTLEAMGGGE